MSPIFRCPHLFLRTASRPQLRFNGCSAAHWLKEDASNPGVLGQELLAGGNLAGIDFKPLTAQRVAVALAPNDFAALQVTGRSFDTHYRE